MLDIIVFLLKGSMFTDDTGKSLYLTWSTNKCTPESLIFIECCTIYCKKLKSFEVKKASITFVYTSFSFIFFINLSSSISISKANITDKHSSYSKNLIRCFSSCSNLSVAQNSILYSLSMWSCSLASRPSILHSFFVFY